MLGLDAVGVVAAHVVDPEADVAVPAEAPALERVLDQVDQVDHQQRLASLGPRVQVVDDAAAQVAFQLGVALPQIGQQRLADQLVHGEAVAERLGDGQPGELPVAGLGVLVGQHAAHQLAGGGPGHDGDAERRGPDVVQLGLDQPVQQRLDDVGPVGPGGRVPVGVGQGRVGGQRQGQRRSRGPVHDVRDACIVEPVGGQQPLRVPRPQHVQVQPRGHRLPAAGEPAGIGRAPAGDDDQGLIGQAGQQLAAQVRPERGHPLVGVEQHQRPGVPRGVAQRGFQHLGRRAELAAVDGHDADVAVAGPAGGLAQQRALADAAGAGDEDHAGRRVGVVQAPLEEGQLAGPPGEAGAIPVRQPGGQRPARWGIPHLSRPACGFRSLAADFSVTRRGYQSETQVTLRRKRPYRNVGDCASENVGRSGPWPSRAPPAEGDVRRRRASGWRRRTAGGSAWPALAGPRHRHGYPLT